MASSIKSSQMTEPSMEPNMEDVLRTLRFLSKSSITQRSQLAPTMGDSSTSNLSKGIANRCPKCTGIVQPNQISVNRTGRRSREQILKSLDQLEEKLKADGKLLPKWVDAYREGNSLKAAKMIHLDYIENKMRPVAVKRPSSEVGVPTSTTNEGNEDAGESGMKKRRSYD